MTEKTVSFINSSGTKISWAFNGGYVVRTNGSSGRPAKATWNLTDAQIAAISDQTSVSYQYFLAGNTSTIANATQYYRTEARPFTLAEFTAYSPKLPVLLSPSPATLVSSTLGAAPNLYFSPPASGPLNVGWSVSSGAPTVATLNVLRYIPGVISFYGATSGIASTATVGAVYCQPQTSSDPHCTAAANYASTAVLDGIQIQAPNVNATNVQNFYLVSNLY